MIISDETYHMRESSDESYQIKITISIWSWDISKVDRDLLELEIFGNQFHRDLANTLRQHLE